MLDSLNPEQKKAVLTTKGRILVLAGAGSGKTSVLTCRMAYLIQEKSVLPENILGLTFTNKAAGEMRSRLARFSSPQIAKRVTLCTFHSFCMQLLRKEIYRLGFTTDFSLYDEKDVKRLLTHIVRHVLEQEGDLPSLQTTMEELAHAKNQGHSCFLEKEDLEEEETTTKKSWHAQFSKDLLHRLNLCMRSYNAVDFDSLLTLSVQLLEEHPLVLEQLQEKYQYILIDEYQDTNPVQYKLAELLSQKHGNLCVVGDDDQSIYGWRGAEIKQILHFPADALIKLEQNYRSVPNILHAANHVIANNKERHHKELWSNKSSQDKVLLFHAPNEIEEAQSVVQRILWYKKHKNLRWKDMAILYRSNTLSRSFETMLLQSSWEEAGIWHRGIPYIVFGGTEFYERSEIKDLFAYLRVLSNPKDEEALLRIINTPRRGISDLCLDTLTRYNRSEGIPLWDVLFSCALDPMHPITQKISSKAVQNITDFLSLMQKGLDIFQTEKTLSKALELFIDIINYKKAIKEEVKSDQMRAFKWDNVMGCIETLATYETNKCNDPLEPTPSLQDFLSTTLLADQKMSKGAKTEDQDFVPLMTIHSAKGLEFEVCFVVGLEDHILPHEKSKTPKELEEERRLMYVAMTRAKKHLVLSMARERKKMGHKRNSTPSRFLFEIPKELLHILSYQTIDPSL